MSSTTITRRSFLQLAGCTAVAMAVPAFPDPAAARSQAVTDLAITHMQLYDTRSRLVGPVYEIPAEWFEKALGGEIIARGMFTIVNWDGPPCFIEGVALLHQSHGEIVRFPIEMKFNHVGPGDSVVLSPMRITNGHE